MGGKKGVSAREGRGGEGIGGELRDMRRNRGATWGASRSWGEAIRGGGNYDYVIPPHIKIM